MRISSAGILLPFISSLLFCLTNSSPAQLIPTLGPATPFALTTDPPLVLAQRAQESPFWTIETIVTTTIEGTVATFTNYDCPMETDGPVLFTYDITQIAAGVTTMAEVTVRPCRDLVGADRKGSLGTSAIVGIAVSLTIPILAGLIFFFWRLRRKQMENDAIKASEFHRQRKAEMNRNISNPVANKTSVQLEEVALPRRARGGVVTNISAGTEVP
ncbi:hypothetical protein ABW20_dc0103592 [Dactylellina cionopaga]|nr:hypothetical protein ABW20_dc0103592 [Dactylellina cionopaga]